MSWIEEKKKRPMIKGAVPGSKGNLLIIRDAIKPKSLMVKVQKDEIVEESSQTQQKAESKEADQKKKNELKTKEDKK